MIEVNNEIYEKMNIEEKFVYHCCGCCGSGIFSWYIDKMEKKYNGE